MKATLIQITLTKEIEQMLETLKREYLTLYNAELFKLGLAELYRKTELAARERWAESLPTLEISEAEAKSIAEARKELPVGGGRGYTPEELIAEALKD